ncbi:FAD:protein FMN transferase [Bacillota bacterium Lsc_1132]
MYDYRFHSMSTIVQISITSELFANDLMPVYKKFVKIEDLCSRFRNDSELSQLNEQIGKEVPVSNELFAILETALRFYEETGGVFNPGILHALEQTGYTKSIEHIRGREISGMDMCSPRVHLDKPFLLNEHNSTAFLRTKLDLGGIAKGWVIDQASELLAEYGAGFINVGGDIRIFGTLSRPLNIGIEDPFEPEKIISDIEVENGAIATSTSMKRRWKVNGVDQHHLIDPFTGEASKSSIVSATVIAPTAVEADVWAKVVLLLGEEKGRRWIAEKGTGAVFINRQKVIWREGYL